MNVLSSLMLQTFLKSLKQAASGLSVPHTSHQVAPGTAVAAAGLGSQLGLAWAHPSLVQVVAICRWLYSSCQMALGRTQAMADLGLHLPRSLIASTSSG